MGSLKKMPVDPLTVPVPAGVSPDELVRAIGTFIGLKCNPYRNPSPDTNFNHNLYVARYTNGSVEHVAVVNATNLPEQEAEALHEFMSNYHANACIICASDLPPHPNNAAPLVQGRCCDLCNQTHIIPYRTTQMLMTVTVARRRRETPA
jgi:hypothetical protein